MKLEAKDVEELGNLLTAVKLFVPIADEVVTTLFEYGPTLQRLVDALTKHHRTTNLEAFQFYTKNGFTRSEALLLVLNTNTNLQQLMQSLSNVKGKKA